MRPANRIPSLVCLGITIRDHRDCSFFFVLLFLSASLAKVFKAQFINRRVLVGNHYLWRENPPYY